MSPHRVNTGETVSMSNPITARVPADTTMMGVVQDALHRDLGRLDSTLAAAGIDVEPQRRDAFGARGVDAAAAAPPSPRRRRRSVADDPRTLYRRTIAEERSMSTPAPIPRRFRPRRLAYLSAVLAFGAALTSACSSSSPAPQAATAAASSQSASARPTSARRSTAPSAVPDSSGSAQVCQGIRLNLSVLTKAAGSPNDPSVKDEITQIRKLIALAPAEIKGDLTVIADFDEKILAELSSGAGPDVIAETPQLTRALSHEAGWTATHRPS